MDAYADITGAIGPTVERLAKASAKSEYGSNPDFYHPSPARVKEMMTTLKETLFPEFFSLGSKLSAYAAGMNLESVGLEILNHVARTDGSADAAAVARSFVDSLPDVKLILLTDLEATYAADPAATSIEEIGFCYPGFLAMLHFRIAHELYKRNVRWLPRIITELAHSATGIDIHPGAQIGEYFSIDHGTGIVIGETCIIGHHVKLYQGVTLGAKNIPFGLHGSAAKTRRHPQLGNHVTVYSNATILGPVTIGDRSVVGGNIWVTRDIPEDAKVLQNRPVEERFIDGSGI